MMKKIIAVAAVVAVAVSAAGAHVGVDGKPSFTSPAYYNLTDLSGSPLGHFQRDTTSRLNVEAGYQYFGLANETLHGIRGPMIRMGSPGRMFFEASYGLDLMSRELGANIDLNVPLHRVGLTYATRSAGDYPFLASISLLGYIGTQTWDGWIMSNGQQGEGSRVLAGIDRLRLDLGSQVHPLALVTFYISGSGHIDTLRTRWIPGVLHQDRDFVAQTNLPELGLNVLVSGDEIPVDVNFSFDYTMTHIVNSANGGGNIPPLFVGHHANALRENALDFMLQGRGDVDINEQFALSPALRVGYSRKDGGEYEPNEDQNLPWRIGDQIAGDFTYALSGFHLGIGTGFTADKFADVFVEYSFDMMSLDVGDSYRNRNLLAFDNRTESRTLHHIIFGASSSLNKFLELPLEITPRLAYFISGSTWIISPAHTTLNPISKTSDPPPVRAARYLYEPYLFLNNFARTSGFTIGVDGRMFESMLGASAFVTLLNKKMGGRSESGTEFGLKVDFSL